MKILGIETSCDETAIAILNIEENESGTNVRILANEILSQIELHRPYGGVFPNLAKREHEKNLEPILQKALAAAEMACGERVVGAESAERTSKPHAISAAADFSAAVPRAGATAGASFKSSYAPTRSTAAPIDAVVVTQGPGLEPCLWTGINFAKDLAKKWNIPLIPANHMEGHILIALLNRKGSPSVSDFGRGTLPIYSMTQPEFPALALLISGGHTELVLIREFGKYEAIGKTRDDAVGECFDKTARLLGLPYPGGPEISRLADSARKAGLKLEIPLPRPMIDSKNLDFSFSGLKTAVLYALKNGSTPPTSLTIKKFAREIEEAITDVLTAKVEKAIEEYKIESLIAGGGVIANTFIRFSLQNLADSFDIPLYLPHISHATDNALMIALAGYFNLKKEHSKDFGAEGNLNLD